MSAAELCALRVEDVDHREGLIVIHGKGGMRPATF